MFKRNEKTMSKKKLGKWNLGGHLAFQNPRKSAPKAMKNEACVATLWKSRGTRRKPTGGIACKASKWLCIWLGLLHWSAPRRPNHQSKFFNRKRFTHVSANAMRDSKRRFWRLQKSFKIELWGVENPQYRFENPPEGKSWTTVEQLQGQSWSTPGPQVKQQLNN